MLVLVAIAQVSNPGTNGSLLVLEKSSLDMLVTCLAMSGPWFYGILKAGVLRGASWLSGLSLKFICICM